MKHTMKPSMREAAKLAATAGAVLACTAATTWSADRVRAAMDRLAGG